VILLDVGERLLEPNLDQLLDQGSWQHAIDVEAQRPG
jgi:hypothetical protein